MAGLNCEIKWETRLCEVNGELGYFHCWEHWSNVIDASPLRGGHPGGQIGQVYGIVEFKDGVRRVDPVKICFKDEINDALQMMNEHNGRPTTIRMRDAAHSGAEPSIRSRRPSQSSKLKDGSRRSRRPLRR